MVKGSQAKRSLEGRGEDCLTTEGLLAISVYMY